MAEHIKRVKIGDKQFDLYAMSEGVIPPGGKMEIVIDTRHEILAEDAVGVIFDKDDKELARVRFEIREVE